MKVVLSPRAVLRLREIQAYIAYDNVAAAVRVVSRIRQATEILADHPWLGPVWSGHTRALLVTGLPYRVHYRIDESAELVEVITIVHTSQKPLRLQ